MSDTDAVLFANEAFYRAFADADVEAMDRVWADREDVICIHPGWGPIHGRAQVMESWAQIISAGSEPRIRCLGARAKIHGEIAIVVCFEELPGGRLAATNLFARDGRLWKMILHQAGPTTSGPGPQPEGPAGAMH